jgi:hypothetical protein
VDGRILRERAASRDLTQCRAWRILFDSTVREWDKLDADVFGTPPDVAARDDAEDGDFQEEDNRRFREHVSPVITEAQWSTLAGLPDRMIVDEPTPAASAVSVPTPPVDLVPVSAVADAEVPDLCTAAAPPSPDGSLADTAHDAKMRIVDMSSLVFDRLGFQLDRSTPAPPCSLKLYRGMSLLGLSLHLLGGERRPEDLDTNSATCLQLHMTPEDDHQLGGFLETLSKRGDVLLQEQTALSGWKKGNELSTLCSVYIDIVRAGAVKAASTTPGAKSDLPSANSWLLHPDHAPWSWKAESTWVVQPGVWNRNGVASQCWCLAPKSSGEAVRWTVLYNAVVVVEILQSSTIQTAEQLMVHCAESGIRFNMPSLPVAALHVDRGMQEMYKEDRLAVLKGRAMGYHSSVYACTIKDYTSYRRDCMAVLKDPILARAALMASGFAWRIAIAVLSPKLVLDGASADARSYGLGGALMLGGSGGTAQQYVDNELVQSIELFLVGTFHTVTGAKNDRHYVKSFFPPRSVFKKYCPAGSWTARWEQWFCELNADYTTLAPDHAIKAKAQPRRRAQWIEKARKQDKLGYKCWLAAEDQAQKVLAAAVPG